MEATQDWDGARAASRDRLARGFAQVNGDPLRQALMRPVVVEVPDRRERWRWL
jgi:hypothetical protein